MDRAALKRTILLFLFVGSVIIAVIYLIIVSNSGSEVLEASGTVEAVSVLVGPEAPGRVMEVFVEEGAYVEQGEPLFSLDDEILQHPAGPHYCCGRGCCDRSEFTAADGSAGA